MSKNSHPTANLLSYKPPPSRSSVIHNGWSRKQPRDLQSAARPTNNRRTCSRPPVLQTTADLQSAARPTNNRRTCKQPPILQKTAGPANNRRSCTQPRDQQSTAGPTTKRQPYKQPPVLQPSASPTNNRRSHEQPPVLRDRAARLANVLGAAAHGRSLSRSPAVHDSRLFVGRPAVFPVRRACRGAVGRRDVSIRMSTGSLPRPPREVILRLR
jgi:hypothetical protein